MVTKYSTELECLPLDADTLLSRRELQRITGWSNDRFSRLAALPTNPVPVLIQGENGSSDKYSAFDVYRWMLRYEHNTRGYNEKPLVQSWGDVKRFGDLDKDNPPPTSLVSVAYKSLKPEILGAP